MTAANSYSGLTTILARYAAGTQRRQQASHWWPTDLAARERPVAGYVEDEFRGYLTCRPLCFGFARSWPAHRLGRTRADP
jgi:hypothetical protein